MSWWGKLAGGAFGFMFGGPLGALVGAAIGHNFDTGLAQQQHDPLSQERVQTAFFTALFSVMGHICKADGVVSDDEIRIANAVMADMDLSPAQIQAARRLFAEGKKPQFPLTDVLRQFKRETGRRANLRRVFIEMLCLAAYADGVMHPAELRLLQHVATELGLSRPQLDALLRGLGAGSQQARTAPEADPYAVLNVTKHASDAEVKKAYRRLVSQHHPDKLVAKGLPEEMMRLATQRTQQIRQAYEAIKAQRGF